VAVEALHELVNASAVAVGSLRRQVNMMINIKDSYRDFAQCVDDVIQHYSTTMAIAEPNVCNADAVIDGTHAHIETAVTAAAAVNSKDIAEHQQQQQQQNHKCMLCQLQQLRELQPDMFTTAVHAMQSEFNAKQATWRSVIQRNLQLCEQPKLLMDH
jgi:hypothetical protein